MFIVCNRQTWSSLLQKTNTTASPTLQQKMMKLQQSCRDWSILTLTTTTKLTAISTTTSIRLLPTTAAGQQKAPFRYSFRHNAYCKNRLTVLTVTLHMRLRRSLISRSVIGPVAIVNHFAASLRR